MNKIQHVVIIVKENHTFDNYFGTFPKADGVALPHAANPPASDLNHRHEAWMVRQADTKGKFQYNKTDIPTYFKLAKKFSLCDNFFSEVAGPSTPSHLMLIAAASPVINNPSPSPTAVDAYNLPSLPINLEQNGLTWANYGGYAFQFIKALNGHPNNKLSGDFLTDLQAGKLPNVSWLYAPQLPKPLSEHPTQNITDGMNWTMQQINALAQSPFWNNSAIFLTYDDWGGWYDHVVPPNIEQWDSSIAQRPEDATPKFNGQQFRYGSRVPCIVVSPYAKKGYISKVQHSHISLLRFCEDNFGIPHLNARDAAADGMADCFDFSQTVKPFPKL